MGCGEERSKEHTRVINMNIPNQWEQNPLIVIWEVTRACALACKHCRAEAMPLADPRELGSIESLHFIDQVARANPKIFILTGGDPMYRRDLVHLIEYASRQGLRVAMSPSATPRFLKADMNTFREAGLRAISLSLDGPTRESHDAFRGVHGTWDWTMRALKSARDAGIAVQVNTTITRDNIGQVDAFAELLGEIQPSTWSVFQVVPVGRAGKDFMPSGGQLENMFERLYDISLSAGYQIKTTEGQHYRRVATQRAKKLGKPEPHFNATSDGKGFVFVSHTGDICPSGFLPLSAGNVREDELIEVYRNSPLFRELRDGDLLKGKCGRCEYRFLCGGSRARAYAVTGDYLAAEPLCIYQPAENNDGGTSGGKPTQPIWRMYLDD
jgi:AdoMet-dependent heme synthase